MIQPEEKKSLTQIKALMEKADKIYQTISPATQQKMIEFHAEGASLPFCIRWGLQASQELVEHSQKQKHWN